MDPDRKYLALILGASEFPKKDLEPKEAFRNSAEAIHRYLSSRFKEPNTCHVESLFDEDSEAVDQARRISSVLLENGNATDLIVYYVGHGGFLGNREYYLTLRNTETGYEDQTALPSRTLSSLIRRHFADRRLFVLLDCCFAGEAVRDFQSMDLGTAIEAQTIAHLPGQGTSMLTATSKHDFALAPPGRQYTMFCECLLEVLDDGVKGGGPYLSLLDVGERLQTVVYRKFGAEAVVPEIHLPLQTQGTTGTVELFVNPAYKPIPKRKVARDRTTKSKAVPTEDAGVPELGPIAYKGSIRALALNDDGSRLVIVGQDNLSVWKTVLERSVGREITHIDHELGELCAVAISPNGRFVALGVVDVINDQAEEPGPLSTSSGSSSARDNADNASETRPSKEPGALDKARRLARGAWKVLTYTPPPTPARPCTIHVWDTRTGHELAPMKKRGLSVLAFSADGRWILGGGTNGVTLLWETKTGRALASLKSGAMVNAVSFSPTSDHVASASRGSVRVWKRDSGERKPKPIRILGKAKPPPRKPAGSSRKPAGQPKVDSNVGVYGPNTDYMEVAFSPDGDYLASGDGRTVYVWSLETGRERARFKPDRFVEAIEFVKGYLATLGSDGEVRFWKPRTGGQVTLPKSRTNLPLRPLLVFSADGTYVVRNRGNPVLILGPASPRGDKTVTRTRAH
jgi:WD40 repeat protein